MLITVKGKVKATAAQTAAGFQKSFDYWAPGEMSADSNMTWDQTGLHASFVSGPKDGNGQNRGTIDLTEKDGVTRVVMKNDLRLKGLACVLFPVFAVYGPIATHRLMRKIEKDLR